MWWRQGKSGRAGGGQARHPAPGPNRLPGRGLQTSKSSPDTSQRARGEDRRVGEKITATMIKCQVDTTGRSPSEITANTARKKYKSPSAWGNEARLIIFKKETARNAFKAFPSFFPSQTKSKSQTERHRDFRESEEFPRASRETRLWFSQNWEKLSHQPFPAGSLFPSPKKLPSGNDRGRKKKKQNKTQAAPPWEIKAVEMTFDTARPQLKNKGKVLGWLSLTHSLSLLTLLSNICFSFPCL